MSGRPHRKPWPPTQHQPRPSLKRSLTSIISSFSRKATREKAPRKAASWHEGWETTADPRRVRMAPEPPLYSRATHPRTEIVESGGSALVDAQDAFTNSKQAVWTRILWSFPSEHDTSAQMTLARIESRGVVEGLASLGVRKYLETGKGAIFCSAQHNANDSRRLLVDWVTFRDTQRTRDKLLQQDVLRNDPGATVMVYVFKLSSDKRSVAIWRRRIPLSNNIQGRNSAAISVKKRQMKAIEDDYVIKISPANNDMARGSSLRRLATLTRRGIHA